MNSNVSMTLDDCVAEVLSILTGQELMYQPEMDRYQAITRALNRATRAHALEAEYSYYSSTLELGKAQLGDREIMFPRNVRPRVIGDDSVRFVDDDGRVRLLASFLPRDALAKYNGRAGLWCAYTRNSLAFSRALGAAEEGLNIHVPVMREPRMFELTRQPEDPNEPLLEVSDDIRQQLLDYDFPDVIIMRAAYLYAQTDPIMQPRAQTLEAAYKDLMYQVNERDQRFTDSPYQNEFTVPITGGLFDDSYGWDGYRQLGDERR